MTYQRKEIIGDCTLYLGDAMAILPTLQTADAVVTDWPYGIGEAAGKNNTRGKLAAPKDYGNDSWDNDPISDGLVELVRLSGRWNILWGGNYYNLPKTTCWLVWDKDNGANDFADCELAWTNLNKAVRRIKWRWAGMLQQDMANKEERFHPTQKPLEVMRWAIKQLPGDSKTIIDPFMGSGTTGVACVKLDKTFIGIEREAKYFDIACRRIEEAYKQPDLFIEPPKKIKQEAFI